VKCTSCGTRAEPVDGTFSCPFCAYTQRVPTTWQPLGHSPTLPYRPAPEPVTPANPVPDLQRNEAQANKPNHPSRFPPDDPRNIAWRAKVSAANTGKSHRRSMGDRDAFDFGCIA
jgi:hypothetical protein